MADAMQTGNQNQGLLIAAWILAFLFSPVGLILSIIGKNKGDARFKVPLIVSIVVLALNILWWVMAGSLFASMM